MIDTYEKLDIGFDKVKCVIHLSDVHIRLTKRHGEYREVFEKVYEGIKKSPPNTLIVNSGDTFHSKIDLSPEAVSLASEFLKKLADLRPTILIAGNHDCLLTNSTRLDSLSPIVDNLNHPNLFYLKETKLYGAGNILFNNMSVFDEPTKYIQMKDVVKSIKTKFDCTVALFHGPVDQAKTEIGYQITNRSVTTDTFEGHDIAMLGDIHLIQDLQSPITRIDPPIIHYAGSLIMQNHGELLDGHGYTVWNIDARKYIHIEVPNDYAYYSIDIVDGKLVTDIADIPAKPKLRVRCKESVATEVKKIITEIRKVREITDLVYVRIDTDALQRKLSTQTAANLTQISNVDYQNSLITAFVKEKYPDVDKATLEAVVDINKTLNDNFSKDDQSRNIRWKPIRFEFSNMFSYGEDNVIDFTKLNNVYGMFAPNASGKSTLMDALSFCIFDKASKTYKASLVMNSEKMSFKCKFNFEINGVSYFIERSGSRDKKGNVKVDVNFYKIVDDKEVPLNAEARRSTNEIIRDYLGTYDDFILTTLSLQKNNGSFIDMGQSERKELLSQFIGLNLFEKLSLVASDRIKEISAAIRAFNKEDNTKKSAEMSTEIDSLTTKLEELQKSIADEKIRVASYSKLISEENSNIVTLENVPSDLDELTEDKQKIEDGLEAAKESVEAVSLEIESLKATLASLKKAKEEFDSQDIDSKVQEYESIIKEKTSEERELDRLKLSVKEKIKKLDNLDKHEYDPNCVYCINNVFVKDAISTRESLSGDKKKAVELISSIKEKGEQSAKFEPYLQKKREKDGIDAKLPIESHKLSVKELKLSQLKHQIEKDSNQLNKVIADIELYEKSKEIIQTNAVIRVSIAKLNQELKNCSIGLKNMESEYIKEFARKTSLADQLQLIKTRIEEVEIFEKENVAFECYSHAIGPNGIPYQIISNTIPQIEAEVNNILNQVVDFGMAIETDGKNVNVYITYEDRKWPLELGSGMEQFIASLSLRVALINVSNLPRANFMVIDEGFSALDALNFPMVHSLFDFMKKNFDFLIIVSHLDAMRDMVDSQLEIVKENGFSKIDNTK